MNLKKLITDSVTFNNWANQKYVDWLSTKPEELLHKEIPSSFSSILKTLNHIWGTQEYWWGITAETDEVVMRYHAETFDRDEIFEGLIKNSSKLVTYVDSLSDADLSKNIKLDTEWFKCDFSKFEYIQHLVIHGTYHRGQVVTIGRNIGITDAPMTDYNFWNIYKEQA